MNQYQIEYRLNGISNIFEIYLFVNPLGQMCYETECELLRLLDVISSDVELHILPFHNQKLVETAMDRLNLDKTDLNLRNQVFQIIYQSSLAYKAACIQGKRLGRLYLMRAQEKFNGDIFKFNEQEILDIAKEIGLDIETFYNDFKSDFVRQLFFQDQKVAVELGVTQPPSLVIFESFTGEGTMLTSRPITLKKILNEMDHLMEVTIDTMNEPEDRPNLFRLI